MKKIFVCSPLRGNYNENLDNAKKYTKYVIDKGHIPFTPHIYFTQVLNDGVIKERTQGINLGIKWLSMCDELWYFGYIISEGMQKEIDMAKELKLIIVNIKC